LSRIAVTGMGLTSAIGKGTDLNRQALIQGKCGIGVLEGFTTRYAGLLPCAEIKESNEALQARLSAFEPGVTRTMLLALDAFQQAVSDAGLNDFTDPGIALVNATTVGGMCLTDELYKDSHASAAGSEYLSSYDLGSVAVYLQQRYGIKGIINTFNTACSSSANALMYGARLLQHGRADKVIAGGVDSLAKFTLNGFNALRILAPELCRPFDKDRQGLNLGEGAAFLVLEREKDVKPGTKIYAFLSGAGNAADAYHPSSLSDDGEGPLRSMQQALTAAGLQPADISYVNAHGTATENNDEVEARAMIRLFGEYVPPFSSTKGSTGHTLGAAGAVEAVYSVLSLAHQEIYPGLRFETPIPASDLKPVTAYRKAEVSHVMSNSFGFGGNCSTLIFSKA
jgi:3-oxoacyl-(acyl-carrier-protein) synthase